MDFGWSDRGQWFPFPCQLRSKHRDTGSYFSSVSGPMSSAVKLKIPISEKRKRACPPFFPPPLHLCPTPHHPIPCPLTFITHFLFMLGRNRGCSWWFEVRRDWPRVTLNKYTRTSQEGAGRLYLLPNHPWLISWQIQGDFLCTLSTIAIPSPLQSTPHSLQPTNPLKVMESEQHRQGNPGSQADGALQHSPASAIRMIIKQRRACALLKMYTKAQIGLHTKPSDQLLQLVVSN